MDRQIEWALDLAEQFIKAIIPHDKERQQMRADALQAIEAARQPAEEAPTLGIAVSDGLIMEDRPGG